jgi:hypothetical protein
MHEMSNLKLGRRGKINSLTLSRRISNRPPSPWYGTICKCDRCFISIMKLLSTLNDGTGFPEKSGTVKRHKCRHLLRTGRTFFKERSLLHQNKVMSVIVSAGSNSAKSLTVREFIYIPSLSTWRQLLTIYKEVSSFDIILKRDQCYLFQFTCFVRQNVQFLQFLQMSNFVKEAIQLFRVFDMHRANV